MDPCDSSVIEKLLVFDPVYHYICTYWVTIPKTILFISTWPLVVGLSHSHWGTPSNHIYFCGTGPHGFFTLYAVHIFIQRTNTENPVQNTDITRPITAELGSHKASSEVSCRKKTKKWLRIDGDLVKEECKCSDESIKLGTSEYVRVNNDESVLKGDQ